MRNFDIFKFMRNTKTCVPDEFPLQINSFKRSRTLMKLAWIYILPPDEYTESYVLEFHTEIKNKFVWTITKVSLYQLEHELNKWNGSKSLLQTIIISLSTETWNSDIVFLFRWRCSFLFVSKTCNQFINVDQMQKRAHNTLLFGIWFPLVSKLKSCYWTVSMKTNQFLIYIVVMYRGIDGVHSLASSLSKVIFKEKLLFMIEHLHLDTESVWASTACRIANMDLCECYGVAEHFSKRLKSHFIALESSEKHDINYDKT